MNKLMSELCLIKSLFFELFSLLRLHSKTLLKKVGWLLLLYFLIELLYYFYAYEQESLFSVEDAIWFFLSALISVFIAVRIHRVLIDEHLDFLRKSEKRLTNFQSYVLFAIRTIWLTIVAISCFFPLALVMTYDFSASIANQFLTFIAVLICLVLFFYASRLFLSLPSLAMRIPMSLSESSALTKNHKLLMFSVVIVIPTILALSFYFVSFIDSKFLTIILESIIEIIVVVFEIMLLSMAYIEIQRSTKLGAAD